MPDIDNVIKNLSVVYNYLKCFENTAKMGTWVHDALELLKPVPPVMKGNNAYCGNCGLRIPYKNRANFCYKCGRAVDWK